MTRWHWFIAKTLGFWLSVVFALVSWIVVVMLAAQQGEYPKAEITLRDGLARSSVA
jgi:hypothetical protein